MPTEHSFVAGCLMGALPRKRVTVEVWGFLKPVSPHARIEFEPNAHFRELGAATSLGLRTDLWTSAALVKEILSRKPPFVILVRNRTIPAVVAGMLCRIRRNRFVIYQISNFHGEQILETENPRLRRRIAALTDILLRGWATKLSHLCYGISDAMATFLADRHKLDSQRLRAMPLGIDTTRWPEFTPWAERDLDAVYIGTYSKSRSLMTTLAAIKIASGKKKLRVHFYGASHDPKDDLTLRQHVLELDLEDVVHVNDSVSRAEIDAILSRARVGLSLIPPVSFLRLSSPTKAIEYIAAGCRVLAAKGIPDQDEVVESTGGGTLCEWNEEDAAAGLLQLLAESEAEETRARAAQERIKEQRSYDELAGVIAADVRQLLQDGK